MKQNSKEWQSAIRVELFSATLVHHILSYLKKNKKSKKWLATKWYNFNPTLSYQEILHKLDTIFGESNCEELTLSELLELASICNIKIELTINGTEV